MSVWYVRSGASGSNNGSSWTNAYTKLEAAFGAGAAGDTFYVASDHVENKTSTATWALTCPGTVSSPCYIISSSTAAEPPTTGTPGAIIDNASGNYLMSLVGSFYAYGITFKQTPNNASCDIVLGSTSSGFAQVYEECDFQFAGGSSGTFLNFVTTTTNSSIDDCYVKWINTDVKFSHASQCIYTYGLRFIWQGGSVDSAGTAPTYLFNLPPGNASTITIDSVDLSKVTGTLFDVDAASCAAHTILASNCKLGSGVKVSNTITGPGGVDIKLENCDSGDTNYRLAWSRYSGSIITETTKVRTGGANDGTTTLSWKMASLSGCNFAYPLISPEIAIWNETTGSSKTVTVEFLHDSTTNLKDDEIWMECVYLGTSGYPLGSLTTDRKASFVATAADQTGSSATWTTTGLTNPNNQKMSVTFTPQEKGFFIVKIVLAKSSYTVYVDPKLTVS